VYTYKYTRILEIEARKVSMEDCRDHDQLSFAGKTFFIMVSLTINVIMYICIKICIYINICICLYVHVRIGV
jgi:hypothetical protein